MARRSKNVEKISFEERLADTHRFVSIVRTSDLHDLKTDTMRKYGDTPEIFAARKYRSLAVADNLGDEYPGRAAARYSRLPDNVLMDVHERSEYLTTRVRQAMVTSVLVTAGGLSISGIGLALGFNQLVYGVVICSGAATGASIMNIRDANKSLTIIKQAVDNHLDSLKL